MNRKITRQLLASLTPPATGQAWHWDSTLPGFGVLLLPDSKTGARPVERPAPAWDVIDALPYGSPWLIPNDGRTGPLQGYWRRWHKLRTAAQLHGLRLHDLRHTVGSMAHRAGMTQRQVADLLGHRQIGTAARYIHGADAERKRAAEVTAGHIAGLLAA